MDGAPRKAAMAWMLFMLYSLVLDGLTTTLFKPPALFPAMADPWCRRWPATS
jgi:hypothetical protein